MNNVSSEKKSLIINALSLVLLFVYITFVALDIVAYVHGGVSGATFYLKLFASFLCTAVAWAGFSAEKEKHGGLLRAIAFTLTFLGDTAVLLNTYKIMSDPFVFKIGGYLFVPALLLISIRSAKGFGFFFEGGRFQWKKLIFPLCFYIPFAVLLVSVGAGLAKVGLLGLGIVYGTCLTTVLWTGWESLHSGLFPHKSAVLIAAGSTLVFVMELIGLVYNLHVPVYSDIAFFATWILYTPGMLLIARS
ncbi:MAG TPA: hypothetical protein VIS94_06535 [Desulfomonilia bacterium]